MSKTLAMDELRKLREEDLLPEIGKQYRIMAKLSLAVKSGKEKGSHLLKNEKLQLARMLSVLSELRHKDSVSTMPAPTPVSTPSS